MWRTTRRFYRPIRPARSLYRGPRQRRGYSSGYDLPDLNRHSIKRIVLSIFWGATVLWFFYFFFLSDNWAIKNIQISGLESIPEAELARLVTEEIGRKRLFIIPNNNLLLFSKSSLASRLQKKYIMEEISIQRDLPFTLNIEIKEKPARLILKAVSKMEVANVVSDSAAETTTPETITATVVTSTEYFYLDVNGIVVGQYTPSEPGAENEPVLPLVEIEYFSQTLIKPGDTALASDEVGYIFALYDALARSSANIKLTGVIYNPQVNDEIKFTTSEGWQGLVSKKLTLETQVRKLEQVLLEKIQDKRGGLKYVDLRVKDRVYFK